MYMCCKDGNKREHTGHSYSITGKTIKKVVNWKSIAMPGQQQWKIKWNIYQHTLTMRNLERVYASSLLLEYHWKESWTVCSHTQHIATSLYMLYRCMRKYRPSMNFKQNVTRQQFVTRQDCRLIKSSYIVQIILYQNFVGTYAVNWMILVATGILKMPYLSSKL